MGGKPLKPETSKNFSFGGSMKFGGLKVTIDYFNIKMEDRLTQVGAKPVTQAMVNAASAATKASLVAYGALDSNGNLLSDLSNFTFFTNDFGTTTSGVDFVATYPLNAFGGRNNITFVANHTDTKINYGKAILGSTVSQEIEYALPKDRASLSIDRNINKLTLLGRLNYFGKYIEAHADDDTLNIHAKSQITFDADVSYHLNEKVTFSVGANNLFDSYPTNNPWASILGAKYPVTAPNGFMGGFYYLKLSYKH